MIRKIGVFDSGVGGAATLSVIQQLLPDAEYRFLSDQAHLPYGDKTLSELVEITTSLVSELRDWGAEIVVIACNTATTKCIRFLRQRFPEITFVGTEPALKVACDRGFKNILLLATPSTINSDQLQRLIIQYVHGQKLTLLPCSGLADVIERGFSVDQLDRPLSAPAETEINQKLNELFSAIDNPAEIDAVVLGCTHYPLIAKQIQCFFPQAELIDGNLGVAKCVQTLCQAQNQIYLDHAAATPVIPKAFAAMQPYFSEQFYNPSAPYLPAKRVREAYEGAKDAIAHVIGAKGVDLVITSGATESINLAFTACSKKGKVLALPIEHVAVLEAAKLHDYALVDVNRAGLIDLDDFRKKLTPEVEFVSVSLANNELGTIQPIAEIAEIIRAERQSRLKNGNSLPLYLHSDASQALNLLDINVARLGVDLLTLNAAKCGGPKGVGTLYIAHGVKLSPVAVGGGQERGLRSGTENVPGVIGFATAAAEAKAHLAGSRKKYQTMATILRQELKQISQNQNLPEPIFLGNPKHQLANFVPVCFPGLDAERLIYKLEQQGIYLSTGAACAANKGSKSHVLAAVGLSDAEIAGSLRISLGSTNTIEQIKDAAGIIVDAVTHEYHRSFSRGSGATARASATTLQRQASSTRHEKNSDDTLSYRNSDKFNGGGIYA